MERELLPFGAWLRAYRRQIAPSHSILTLPVATAFLEMRNNCEVTKARFVVWKTRVQRKSGAPPLICRAWPWSRTGAKDAWTVTSLWRRSKSCARQAKRAYRLKKLENLFPSRSLSNRINEPGSPLFASRALPSDFFGSIRHGFGTFRLCSAWLRLHETQCRQNFVCWFFRTAENHRLPRCCF